MQNAIFARLTNPYILREFQGSAVEDPLTYSFEKPLKAQVKKDPSVLRHSEAFKSHSRGEVLKWGSPKVP